MRPNLRKIFFFATVLGWGLLPFCGPDFSSPAWAQLTSTGPSSQIAPGRRLTNEMVRQELERRLARNPGNEAAIWNAGYDFFRHYPQNQDTARAIKEGFLRARTNDPGQRAILNKAATYWANIHDYGIANVPAGQNQTLTQRKYYGRNSKQSTLPRRKSGTSHQGYPPYDWPGRYIDKGQPYSGRQDNPYPGKYYPGVYPP